MSHAIG